MKRLLTLNLLILSAVLVTGCSQIVTSGSFTLRSGDTLPGGLIATSGEIALEESSRVIGSVFMTSGKLKIDGEVDGDVLMTSGTVVLGPRALVRGSVSGTSGEVQRAEGARVEGRIAVDGGSFFDIATGYCMAPIAMVVLAVLLLSKRGRQWLGLQRTTT